MDVPIKPIRMFLRMKKIYKIQSLKYGFFKKLFLYKSVAHFFHPKLDSPVIKILEKNFILSDCLSNVLITWESNLDERNGLLIRDSFLKK